MPGDPDIGTGALFGQFTRRVSEQIPLITGHGDDPPPFTELKILGTYTPAVEPLESFYLPMLSRAIAYDRAVGYWSASEIRFAAQGVATFLANGGHMRLIVGAQLADADVQAVLHGEPLDGVLADRMLADPAWAANRLLKNDHLAVLAWMIKARRLEIKVGVPTDGERLLSYEESGNYFHSKFGVLRDTQGNRVAFSGSNNSTAAGWMGNHESFGTFPSWIPAVWEWNGRPIAEAFERLWAGVPDPGWQIVSLPHAVREHLISSAPASPPLPGWLPPDESGLVEEETAPDLAVAWEELVDLSKRPHGEQFTAAGTAPMEPLPHQAVLVHRAVTSYPRGYLFADEVGLGKTIEAGLVIRELILSGRAKTALLLVPASVMKQWQEELHEKVGLDVARYDGQQFIDRFDQPLSAPKGKAPWCAFDIVLASSHLARRASRRDEILDAGPWDIVFVDEAHHARRRGSKANDTPNALLRLLIEMRNRDSWGTLYLASATPMQMNQHEAWDLISLLALPGAWGESAKNFLNYYEQLRQDPPERNWRVLSSMLADYFSDAEALVDEALRERIERELGWVDSATVTGLDKTPISSEQAQHMGSSVLSATDAWLRRHTPMRDRVFRNTRATMRAYKAAGLVLATIPVRHVTDDFIELDPDFERPLYERIESYIRRHYNAYKTTTTHQALGFIMTIYRRRLTSSFEAIRASLRRRLTALEQGQALGELLADDDMVDVDATLFDDLDDFDTRAADLLSGEIVELRDFLKELDNIQGEDTKASRLVRDVADALMTEPSVVVFTQYTDTLDYVREKLVLAGHTAVACYSGRGGELYNPASRAWEPRTKSEIKQMFREGFITVLMGTDAMSEGLNLQTSGRVINYDVPWNLMRVEQRIGRVDRIGGRAHVNVTNYFYADTVEQRVYDGILGDYADFTDIVGNAQPVLGDIERSIEQLALAPEASSGMVSERVEGLREAISDVGRRPVQLSDFGDPEPGGQESVEAPPSIAGPTTLDDLRAVLTSNPLTARRFVPVGPSGVYRLRVAESAPFGPLKDADAALAAPLIEGPLVTFDWRIADSASEDIEVLTYGNAYMSGLLPKPQ